ncbi:unnamed protein product [Cuscuta campestris]|uniref:DDE Tnp4 domain-containing protein n=1 Tax=Cuscuta campestris TaxID=132261 RepID=A0A484L3U4_9ASTE|nr:unnamed protein product [Cuscuta campestris]
MMIEKHTLSDDMDACLEKLETLGWDESDAKYETVLLLFGESADLQKLWVRLKPQNCEKWVKNAGAKCLMDSEDKIIVFMILCWYWVSLASRINLGRIRDLNSALTGHEYTQEIFPGAIGALDGTLIHAIVPVDQQTRYRGRGKDKYYLCDAAYTNTPGFMTPYRGTRYWLADFRRQRALTKEERFNHAHAELRNVIERAYGVLKARFPILKQMAPFSFPIQRDIVIACFAIHNFKRKCNIYDQLFMEYDENTMFHEMQTGENDGLLVQDI